VVEAGSTPTLVPLSGGQLDGVHKDGSNVRIATLPSTSLQPGAPPSLLPPRTAPNTHPLIGSHEQARPARSSDSPRAPFIASPPPFSQHTHSSILPLQEADGASTSMVSPSLPGLASPRGWEWSGGYEESLLGSLAPVNQTNSKRRVGEYLGGMNDGQ
jgi:hypothetical protein